MNAKQYIGNNLEHDYFLKVASANAIYLKLVPDGVLLRPKELQELVQKLHKATNPYTPLFHNLLLSYSNEITGKTRLYAVTQTAMDIIAKIQAQKFKAQELARIPNREPSRISIDPSQFFELSIREMNNKLALFAQYFHKPKGSEVVVFGGDLVYDTNTGKIINVLRPEVQEAEELFRKVILYVHFTKAETIILPPGKSNGKSRKQGKITNDTTRPITIIDSRWNTEVIRKEGFDVAGHFRLQPKGPKHDQYYELIFIEPFRKYGYVRQQKKLD